MSESSLSVIVLPSLVDRYFELDIEQDEMRSKKLNELNDFCSFWSNSLMGGREGGGLLSMGRLLERGV